VINHPLPIINIYTIELFPLFNIIKKIRRDISAVGKYFFESILSFQIFDDDDFIFSQKFWFFERDFGMDSSAYCCNFTMLSNLLLCAYRSLRTVV